MQEVFRKLTLVWVILVATAFICPAQVSLPLNGSAWNDHRTAVLANMAQTRVTISLPYETFMYKELFPITVRIHNPTRLALELPVPFHLRTGRIVVDQKDSPRAKEYGLEYFPMSPTQFTVDPISSTFVLGAGETITRIFWSVSKTNDFEVIAILHPGKYRLRYDHWPSDPAYFEVVGAVPVGAVEVLDLPDRDLSDRKVPRTAVFTVQLGEDRWLLQVRPTTIDYLQKDFLSSWPTLTTDQLPIFYRIARLPGPLSRLSATLIGDATLHIEYETLGGGSRTIETKLATGEVIREW